MRSVGKTLLSNSAWSLLNQSARVGALAVVTIALSRHFGPQRFGALAFGLAFVRIFAVVAAFGLDRLLVRRLAENPEQTGGILRLAFRLKLFLALASYVALLGLAFLIDPHGRLTVAIVALAGAGLLCQPFDVFDLHFQSENRFRLSFFGRTIPILLSTGIKLVALLAGAPLLVFAALETVEAMLVGVALWLLHRRRTTHFASQPTTAAIDWRRLLGEGFPLLLGSLAVMIYMRSDVLMLGKMAGFKAAGIYSAAAQISEACALLPLALMPALFPVLVRWRRHGIEFYRRQFERLFLVAIIGGLAFSIALTFGAREFVQILFGTNYLAAASVLIVHGWTIIFVFMGITQSGYEVTEGLTWFGTAKTIVGAVMNLVLNIVLIPSYGAVGSAVATLLSQIFSSVLLNAFHPKTRPILRMQLTAILIWPVLRGLAREWNSGETRGWQVA